MVNLVDIAKDLSLDDIPEQIRCVALKCGMEGAVRLTVTCPGIDIYVPVAGKKLLDRIYVQQLFDGRNAGTIAVHLGITRDKVFKYAKQPHVAEDWEMPNDIMRMVEERCGRAVAIELMRQLPGSTIYIPFDGVYRIKRAYITKAFDGTNAVRLAASLGVTERFVRQTISDSYASNCVQLKMDLFDEQKAAM